MAHGHGGKRPGAGRPPGSPNHAPRVDNKKLHEAIETAQVLAAETGEYLFSNDKKTFEGFGLDLLRAVYRAEQLPLRLRTYCASIAARFENQADGTGALDENGQPFGISDRPQVHIYLPDNGRDCELLNKNGVITFEERAEHAKRRIEFVTQQDDRLRRLVKRGKLTQAQALAVRSELFEQRGDPAWREMDEPSPLLQALEFHPPPVIAEEPAPPETIVIAGEPAAPIETAIEIEGPEAGRIALRAPHPGWRYQVMKRLYVANLRAELSAEFEDVEILWNVGCRLACPIVLYCRAWITLQVSSGMVYSSDSFGQILVEEWSHRQELIAMGCKTRRQ
jgi:hypothetical protein